jgi:hypothetical protein
VAEAAAEAEVARITVAPAVVVEVAQAPVVSTVAVAAADVAAVVTDINVSFQQKWQRRHRRRRSNLRRELLLHWGV